MQPFRIAVFCVAVFLPLSLSVNLLGAGKETGAKKCSDGIDNDGDNLIDGLDPDCGQPPAAGVEAGWDNNPQQSFTQPGGAVRFTRVSFSSSRADYESIEPAVVGFRLRPQDLDHTHWDPSYCSLLEAADLLIEAGQFTTKWYLQGGDNCFSVPCVATAGMTYRYDLPDLEFVRIAARTEEFVAADVGTDGDMFQGAATEEVYLVTVKASFYKPGQNRAAGACIWETSIPSLFFVAPSPAP